MYEKSIVYFVTLVAIYMMYSYTSLEFGFQEYSKQFYEFTRT